MAPASTIVFHTPDRSGAFLDLLAGGRKVELDRRGDPLPREHCGGFREVVGTRVDARQEIRFLNGDLLRGDLRQRLHDEHVSGPETCGVTSPRSISMRAA